MNTYQAIVVDHPAPWDLSKAETKEIAETTTFEACDNEAAIEEIEDNYGLDLEHEWARITLKRNGKVIWRNWQ